MAPDTTYTGAVDTNNGTTIAVGTAGALIRIDATSDENELTIDAARTLINRLTEAVNDAEDWTVAHPDLGDDEIPCDSELWLPGGTETCAAFAGHYGAHSVLTEGGQRLRWLGHGADARNEEGEPFNA